MNDHWTTPTAQAQIQSDLVAAAQRLIAGRRRRRHTLLVTAVIVGLLGTTTATAALSGYTTGVPAIDEMLTAIHERAPDTVPSTDLRPGAGGVSAPLELPWPEGSSGNREGVAVAYLSRSGMVCFARTRGEGLAPDGSGVGCAAPNLIEKRLREQAAFVSGGGGASPDTMSVYGFARADVEAITVDGPGGGETAAAVLTEAWSPLGDGQRIKAFAAFVEGEPRPGTRDPFPRVTEVTLSEGRVLDLP